MNTGVIIPAFNAELHIAAVIDGIKKCVSNNNIIVINDGSTDNTMAIAREKDVIVLSHKKNKGKGEALKTGFRKALSLNLQAVITIDADGQHDPQYIPEFIKTLEQSSFDIFIGSRMANIKTMPFHRILSNKITSALVSWRIGQKISDSQSGYRIIKTDVLKNISLTTSHYDTESELILRGGLKGFKIGFVNIDSVYNNEPSSIRVFLDTWRFVKLYWTSFFW